MPTAKLLWGVSSSGSTPHYENELLLGYPPYDWITDRVVREGSEFVQGPSGVEDAWITGRDFTFEGEFRFIPDKPSTAPDRSVVAGPNSWQAFLDYCRDKNDFRFVPYSSLPDFYVEKCYLVEPIRGFGGNLADLTRGVRLVLRSTSMDFTQAMRGIALEYKPGALLHEVSTGVSFSRASSAAYIRSPSTAAQGHTVAYNASGLIRDQHRTSSSERMTLLEHASTNALIRSAALDSTAWETLGMTVTANYRTAPDGTTTADRLVASTSSGDHYLTQSSSASGTTLAMTTGQVVSVTAHLRADTYTYVKVTGVPTTAGGTFGANVDLNSTGRTADSNVSGVGVSATTPTFRELNDGWAQVQFSGYLNSTSTSFQVRVRLTNSTFGNTLVGATSGDGVSVWGVQAETASTAGEGYVPTSYIPTGTTAATRVADSLSFGWPWKPQAMWVYAKWQERGSAYMSDKRVWTLGATTAAAPFLAYQLTTSVRRAIYSGTTDPNSFVAGGAATSGILDDIHEVLVLLTSGGTVQSRSSINGAAEIIGTASTAKDALPGAWVASPKFLLNAGDGTSAGAEGYIHVKVGMGSGVGSIAAARSA